MTGVQRNRPACLQKSFFSYSILYISIVSIAGLFPWSIPSHAQGGCNPYIYGIHLYGDDLDQLRDVKNLMTHGGQPRGWVLVLQGLEHYSGGHNPAAVDAANAGFGVLIRLNWGYGMTGTLPPQSRYDEFASKAALFIQNHIDFCRFYQIGNEANLCAEWPAGGAADGRCKTEPGESGCSQVREWITAERYADAFQRLYNALPTNLRGTAKLVLDPTAVWAGYFRCPGHEFDTDDFLCRAQEYYSLIPHHMIGGIALHPKTHDHDSGQIGADTRSNPVFGCSQNRRVYWYFWVYKDLMGDIPLGLRDRPIFFTELNPHTTGWSNVNNRYVQDAYDEVMNWNATNSDRQIAAMILYRWMDSVPMWGIWDRPAVHEDVRLAVARGQTSNGLTACGGTVPPTEPPTPTPALPPGSLLSRGKPCVASSEFNQNNTAGKAVDGIIDGQHKWTSLEQSPSWWYVDLGTAANLEQVRVYSCGAGGEDRIFNLQAFTVRGSNTGSGTPAGWTVLGSYDSGGQQGADVAAVPVSGTYRYVGLYITDSGIDHYARVHEVEVFGNTSADPTSTPVGPTLTFTPASTPTAGSTIGAEDFESMPGWSSSNDAPWGSAASWTIQSGGQSGSFLQVARTSGGSSAKVRVYTVPTGTSINVSAYMRCPTFSSSYWMEFACKLGSHTAADFDDNAGTWTLIRKFANDGTNGNGNTWTPYSTSLHTGANTQISVGFKLGSSGGASPTVGWDTLRITAVAGATPTPLNTPTPFTPGSFRIGLDPGAPIIEANGNIAFNGAAIQDSGSHWVRINFILGPWTHPGDSTLRGSQNMTWFQTYDTIVNDAISRGLQPYGLISAQAVRSSHGYNSNGYVADYVSNFLAIVNHFKNRVKVYESFNEPNDWAGGSSAQVTPYYFAKMLEDIYRAVKIDNGHWNDPAWNSLLLITGPLFSHDGDTGRQYFTDTWTAGRNNLGWNSLHSTYGTYPFDGVGYHIYVAQGSGTPATVQNAMNYNLNQVWNSVTSLEGSGTQKKLWVSEVGWNTAGLSESAQADNVDTAINLLRADSRVIMTSWFCLRDFGTLLKWGLERDGGAKKPGWYRFQAQAAMDQPINSPTHTPSHTRTNTPTHTATKIPTITPSHTPTRTYTITPSPTPSEPDADGDGIPDLLEGGKNAGTLGKTNMYLPDSDGDGLGDGVEDANRNGVRDAGETHPLNRDSDGDGYEDGVEVLLLFTNPLNAASPGTVYTDSDGDGLPDSIDPSPGNPDTDGDRFLDGYEAVTIGLSAATNPNAKPGLGDVNENGFWDNADAQKILNFFASVPMEAMNPGHSDLDRNGGIDNADAQHSLNFFANILPHLPVR